MRFLNQAGQSMTEYLVVLGVTGAALLASTGEVTEIFDHIGTSYRTQSTEMNKVQLYNSQKVRYSEAPEDVLEEGEETPPLPPVGEPELPEVPSLPYIEMVYDGQGNLVGQVENDRLIGKDGVEVARCLRKNDGECVFVDKNGNILFPDSTGIPSYVDDDGEDLPVVALLKSGGGSVIYGFAYLYKDKLYSITDRKLIMDYIQGPAAKQVMEFNEKGVPQVAGYAVGSQLYSMRSAFDYGKELQAESGREFLTVLGSSAHDAWRKFQPCLIMPAAWDDSVLANIPLSGVYENKFNNPEQRLGNENIGGFLNVNVSECPASKTVAYNAADKSWMLIQY